MNELSRRFLAHPRHGPLPLLLLLLMLVAGVLDAVSLLRLGHVFVANITGNTVIIGLSVAGAPGFSLPASLTALAGFVAGVAMCSAFPEPWQSDRARCVRTAMIAELMLFTPALVVAIAVGLGPDRPEAYIVSALLAAAMGIQNATVLRLAVPEFSTTTVVTTTVTKLVGNVRTIGVSDPATGYRAAAFVSLFVGAVVGGLLVLHVSATAALAVCIVLLATVGVVAHRAASALPDWTNP